MRQWRWGLLGLKHRLAVIRLLVVGVRLAVGVGLILSGRLHHRSRRVLLSRRRLLLITGIGRLSSVRGSQVARRCGILRLIGLRCLTLGAIVLGRGFTACCNSKYQSDGCCRQNDTRR